MPLINRIRRKVREGDYVFTYHALNKSLPDDGYTPNDALNAILTGHVAEIYEHDEREPRYAVVGAALDGYALEVICRFTFTSDLLIITVYAL